MDKFKTVRKGKGIKQTELAEIVGVSKQLINDIEKGRTYPSYRLLRKLENALDSNHRELFDDPETKEAAISDGQTKNHNRRTTAC
jgi:transcriptional regulator with XRE-family HTH domain